MNSKEIEFIYKANRYVSSYVEQTEVDDEGKVHRMFHIEQTLLFTDGVVNLNDIPKETDILKLIEHYEGELQ